MMNAKSHRLIFICTPALTEKCCSDIKIQKSRINNKEREKLKSLSVQIFQKSNYSKKTQKQMNE